MAPDPLAPAADRRTETAPHPVGAGGLATAVYVEPAGDGPAAAAAAVRSADTVNPFTDARPPAGDLLRRRLRAVSGLMAFGAAMLAALAVARLLTRPGGGLPAALVAQVLTCVSLGGNALLLTLVRRPGGRLLVASQWVTVAACGGYAAYLFLEKLADDPEGSMTLFLRHHPAFAAVAYGFSSFTFALLYGVVVPNPWRRAAAQTGVLAAVPVVLTVAVSAGRPGLAPLLIGPFLWVLATAMAVCFATVVYTAYTVERLREDVIRARRVGQYKLLEKLGEGGMGVVYRAEHRLLKRPCAVKLIRPKHADTPSAMARFEREVRAMASLSHWNAVDVYDYGVTDQGLFYYAMELLTGLPARELVRRAGPLPPGRAVYLLRQVCAALTEAHAHGLVHRDVTPANVFVAEVGGQFDVVKLLDFGLVHDADRQFEGGTLTEEGVMMGTPGYMSPEQAAGSRDLDARSDLYSVGAVGFFLLSGRRPFPGESAMQVVAAQLRGEALALREVCPGCPDALAAVIDRCMSPRPAGRYASMAELDAALAAAVPSGWTAADAAAWWQGRTG